MDYQKIYKLFTDHWKQRSCEFKCKTHLHHIIPKACGGSDESDNLVRVTEREHIFLHLLLTKFVKGREGMLMATAYGYMGGKKRIWHAARDKWLADEYPDVACLTPEGVYAVGKALQRDRKESSRQVINMVRVALNIKRGKQSIKAIRAAGLLTCMVILRRLGFDTVIFRSKITYNKKMYYLGEDSGKILADAGLVEQNKEPWIATTLRLIQEFNINFDDIQHRTFINALRKCRNIVEVDPWSSRGNPWLKNVFDKYSEYSTYFIVDKGMRCVTVCNAVGAVTAVLYKDGKYKQKENVEMVVKDSRGRDTSRSKLDPCPFCGSSSLSVEHSGTSWWVSCRECGTDGPEADGRGEQEMTAEEVWNRRCK